MQPLVIVTDIVLGLPLPQRLRIQLKDVVLAPGHVLEVGQPLCSVLHFWQACISIGLLDGP